MPRAKWTVILCQVGAFAFQTNTNLARPFRLASHLAPAVSRAPPSHDDVPRRSPGAPQSSAPLLQPAALRIFTVSNSRGRPESVQARRLGTHTCDG